MAPMPSLQGPTLEAKCEGNDFTAGLPWLAILAHMRHGTQANLGNLHRLPSLLPSQAVMT